MFFSKACLKKILIELLNYGQFFSKIAKIKTDKKSYSK